MNLLSMILLATVSLPEPSLKRKLMYTIEGSYTQKCCIMYDDIQQCVAEIRQKEAKGGVALGEDVFHLVVQPTMDPTVVRNQEGHEGMLQKERDRCKGE
ncbi:hypothetical protein L6452_02091 [Arctium lappa]|uniref:Uncharacterized protein n=1 Tax=Arctium lappa TaxID=4217 RepID=A0ACB9FJH7_ARCLA|nr:hypothetical protein L6452_02091 [Arctium lappa]